MVRNNTENGAEALIAEMNEHLIADPAMLDSFRSEPRWPVIFLVGVPRSGHTLLGQLMIQHIQLAYPSNFIARFWRLPGFGARIQRNVLEPLYDASVEKSSVAYSSYHGLTRGLFGLHEFSFFWNEHIPFGDSHLMTEGVWGKVDQEVIRTHLGGIERELDMPLLIKNGAQLGMNLHRLEEMLPGSLFIISEREPLFVAQSIALMRKTRFGTYDTWHSVKTPGMADVAAEPWHIQIACQVATYLTYQEKALSAIPPDRVLRLRYRSVCEDPAGTLEKITACSTAAGLTLNRKKELETSPLKHSNTEKLERHDFELLKDSLAEIGL